MITLKPRIAFTLRNHWPGQRIVYLDKYIAYLYLCLLHVTPQQAINGNVDYIVIKYKFESVYFRTITPIALSIQ